MPDAAYEDEGVMSHVQAKELLRYISGREDDSVRVKDAAPISAWQEGADMVLKNASFVDVFKVPGR